jgi:hypothetical protein
MAVRAASNRKPLRLCPFFFANSSMRAGTRRGTVNRRVHHRPHAASVVGVGLTLRHGLCLLELVMLALDFDATAPSCLTALTL